MANEYLKKILAANLNVNQGQLNTALSEFISTDEQTISEAQRTQARKNLGLYWSEGGDVVIEWDGDTTGRATMTVGDVPSSYKVSGIILTPLDLASATLTMSNGESTDIPPEYVQELAEGLVMGFGFVFSARAGAYDISIGDTDVSITVPEDGVYFAINEGMYVTRLETVHETVSKINQKFIPDSIARTEDVVKHYVFDTRVDWNELVAAATEFENGHAMILWDGHYVIKASVKNNSVLLRFAENPYCSQTYTKNDSGIVTRYVPSQYQYDDEVHARGIRFMLSDTYEDIGHIGVLDDTINVFGEFVLAPDALIIRASDNDQKRFRITVNSAGVISATEITSNS